ncbi:MAG: hypothetical protein EBU26_04990 [Verrucomicrobia bacterium]|nr:hypothetical protein [Verrucomicrobiota bacterium]
MVWPALYLVPDGLAKLKHSPQSLVFGSHAEGQEGLSRSGSQGERWKATFFWKIALTDSRGVLIFPPSKIG